MASTRIRELKTDDLAMAAFLHLEGHNHREIRMRDRRSAEWIFDSDGKLRECAETYQRGDALVEPLAFNRTLRQVRDELYHFLRNHRRQ